MDSIWIIGDFDCHYRGWCSQENQFKKSSVSTCLYSNSPSLFDPWTASEFLPVVKKVPLQKDWSITMAWMVECGVGVLDAPLLTVDDFRTFTTVSLFFFTVMFYCRDKCIKSFFFLLLMFPIRLLCHHITCKVIMLPLSWHLHWWSKIRQWTLVGHGRRNHISALFPHRMKPLKQECAFFVVEISPTILCFSVFT